jgi:hypothetical protein
MGNWGSPPEFGERGKPPPETSAISIAGQSFFLNDRSHNLAKDAVSLLAYLDKPSSEMKPAHDWLWANKGSFTLHYAQKPRHLMPSAAEKPSIRPPLRYVFAGYLEVLISDSRALFSRLTGGHRPSAAEKPSIRPPLASGGRALPSTPVTILRDIKKTTPARTGTRQGAFANLFMDVYGDAEIRRIRNSRYWRREDPVTQLAPGVTRKIKRTTTLGISSTEATELASSVGLQVDFPNIGSLNGQVSKKLGQTINLSLQRHEEHELILTNDRSKHYRLFAIWHPVQRLEVDVLLRFETSLAWVRMTAVTFSDGSELQQTYADLPAGTK